LYLIVIILLLLPGCQQNKEKSEIKLKDKAPDSLKDLSSGIGDMLSSLGDIERLTLNIPLPEKKEEEGHEQEESKKPEEEQGSDGSEAGSGSQGGGGEQSGGQQGQQGQQNQQMYEEFGSETDVNQVKKQNQQAEANKQQASGQRANQYKNGSR